MRVKKQKRLRHLSLDNGQRTLIDLPLEFEGRRVFVLWDLVVLGRHQFKARIEIRSQTAGQVKRPGRQLRLPRPPGPAPSPGQLDPAGDDGAEGPDGTGWHSTLDTRNPKLTCALAEDHVGRRWFAGRLTRAGPEKGPIGEEGGWLCAASGQRGGVRGPWGGGPGHLRLAGGGAGGWAGGPVHAAGPDAPAGRANAPRASNRARS